ncbi:MAG: CAP domain-containing protein [Planctomycetota bacterium]|jgi:hypothetical protein|nr:CAP domain-containing protein [Planctomycetota bacterium]
MRPPLGLCGSLGFVLVLAAPSAALEPNDFETASLIHLNRLRADPSAEGHALTLLKERYDPGIAVDYALFATEMDSYQAAPPVVFDPTLITAARNHSFYMAAHAIGHGEDPDQAGFTGRDLSERLDYVMFRGTTGGENVFRDAEDPLHGHFAFTVDWGPGGTGGMQSDRGHRLCMLRPRYNVVGIGAVQRNDAPRWAISHAFAIMPGRFIGGVVYRDTNHNGTYDAGEGLGRAQVITSDAALTASSWASGAFSCQLPSRGAGRVVLQLGDDQQIVEYQAGILNHWFEWCLTAP